MTPKTKTILSLVGVAVMAAAIYVVELNSNGETRYQRPGPLSGAQAQAWWDFYWTGNADLNRCYFPFIGGQAPATPPPQTGCANPKPCVPHAAPASGYYQPTIYACANHPDGCYKDQAGTEQPVRLQKIGYIYGLGSSHGACIVDLRGVCVGLVDQCPIQPSTPTPVATFTPRPTITPSGPTPACVMVTVTPSSICITRGPTP